MTKKTGIIALLVILGLLFVWLAYFPLGQKKITPVFQNVLPFTQNPTTFTHPDYGFTLNIPKGMIANYEYFDIKASDPPYGRISMLYPVDSKKCGPNADCNVRYIDISVFKEENYQSFQYFIRSNSYYSTEDIQDLSKYWQQNGWELFKSKDSRDTEPVYAYNGKTKVFLHFENNMADAEMEAVVASLGNR